MINRIRRAVSSSPYMKPVLLAAGVCLGFLSASAQTAGTGCVSGAKPAAAEAEKSGPVVLSQGAETEAVDLEFVAALLAPETTDPSNLRTEPIPTDPPLDDRASETLTTPPAKPEVRQ